MEAFEPKTTAESVVVEVERTENQRKGRSQLQEYLMGTTGLFDEGYVAGPFFERAAGTITFSGDGDLLFDASETAHRPEPLAGHPAEKKKELDEVRALILVQLFKNLPMKTIVSKCEEEHEVRSYRDLLASMVSTDPSSLMGAVD
ncbi:MAG: hypothetical protein ACRD6W_09205 [Nitrososphaerales archaeon]